MRPTFLVFGFLSIVSVSLTVIVSVFLKAHSKRIESLALHESEVLSKLATTNAGGSMAILEYLKETDAQAAYRKREMQKLIGLVIGVSGAASVPVLYRLVSDRPLYLLMLIPVIVGAVLFTHALQTRTPAGSASTII